MANLQAGFSRVDMTPPLGAHMDGYYFDRYVEGVRDPLYINAVAVREGDKAGFYDEVLKSLWGYLSDKLNMPVSELSKDNVSVKLAECHVPEALVAECMELIGECEFARYAPSLSSVSESQLYDKADALMDSLENAIKR